MVDRSACTVRVTPPPQLSAAAQFTACRGQRTLLQPGRDIERSQRVSEMRPDCTATGARWQPLAAYPDGDAGKAGAGRADAEGRRRGGYGYGAARASGANSFGSMFRVTTFGESHGGGVGCVIDGVPPRMKLTQEEIQVRAVHRGRPSNSVPPVHPLLPRRALCGHLRASWGKPPSAGSGNWHGSLAVGRADNTGMACCLFVCVHHTAGTFHAQSSCATA